MIYNITHQTSTWYYSDSVQCIYQVVRRREVGGDVVMSCKYCTHNDITSPQPTHKVQCLPFQQFQVLFTLFSKFFFIFPSLYLFSIGFWFLFSF